MRLVCPECGALHEFEMLHIETATRYEKQHGRLVPIDPEKYDAIFRQVAGEFRSAGCISIQSVTHAEAGCVPEDEDADHRAGLAKAVYEWVGDDMDKAAQEMKEMMS